MGDKETGTKAGAANSDEWGLFSTRPFKNLPVILIALTVKVTDQLDVDRYRLVPEKRQ